MKQGDLSLLQDPVAQELLTSAIPARLSYVWPDGTPRVVPIWFHWTGDEIILCSPPRAPKMKALGLEAKVALTIDTETWPAKVLMIRGTAHTRITDGEIPEYAELTRKYLGDSSEVWREQYRQMFPRPVRISVRPEWVGILDVADNRLPSAILEAVATAT
jgi:hypothetical protein